MSIASTQYQVPSHTKQKIDWATECQTPLAANEDPKPTPKDNSSSPAVSDDGPNEPSTPPSRIPPPHTQSRPPFSSAWRNLPDEFALKMHMAESKPHLSFPSTAAPPAPTGVVHSRASSGDTSSINEAPLQINTAVGAARGSKPFTAGPDARPRFQETLEAAERRRVQNISPARVPAINTAVNGQGPRTSPPRERFSSSETQRSEAARYPSLQDHPQQQQQPTYPSIQHGQFQPQQQGHQGHPAAHRPPPIHVVNQTPSDFRGGMVNDNEFIQLHMPSSTPFLPPQQQQQNRVVSDSGPYTRPGLPPPQPHRAAPQFPPHMYASYPNPHMPMGPNTPQLYDMSLPASPFRAAHQHTASDPATLANMGVNVSLRDLMQPHLSPAMHPYGVGGNHMPPPPGPLMYSTAPQPFYPGQDPYLAAAALRFTGQTPNTPGQPPLSANSFTSSLGSPTGNQSAGGGPSANNRKLGLYKTELCRSWEEKGTCRYGPKCQFAHGEDEIRKVSRHPKYKTEICRTFWVSGSCPYGKRCCFIHTELPAPGAPQTSAGNAPSGSPGDTPTSVNAAPAITNPGRTRSQSVTSDPTDAPQVSLLTRIANQRTAAAAAASTPTEGSSTPTFQFPQQRPNSLRVDTSTLDSQLSMKQNKSAYPYMNNPSLPKNSEHLPLISPGPVTAGPDLGRGASRFGAYDRYNNKAQTPTTTTQPTPTATQPSGSNSLRHSFNGTESLNLQTQLSLAGPSATAGNGSNVNNNNNGNTASVAAHSRSESASGNNWNAPGYARGGGLSAIPNNMSSSPWNGELSVGANRPGSNGGIRGQQ